MIAFSPISCEPNEIIGRDGIIQGITHGLQNYGIPNIRVYTGAPPAAIRRARRIRPLLPVLGLTPVKRLAQWWVGRTVTGPDAEVRERARCHVWGEARDGNGNAAEVTLETPEGYALTAVSSVECTRRLLEESLPAGAWTPAKAFGSGLAASLPGVRVDEVRRRPAG